MVKSMKQKVSTAIILDTRRSHSDGFYPVKLRITYQRKQKYYPVINERGEPYRYTLAEFEKIRSPKARGGYKEISLSLDKAEHAALEVIEKLPVFSFEAFESRYLTDYKKGDVFAAYRYKIAEIKREGRAGTASNYECSYKSLLEFCKNKPLPFTSVTKSFLQAYEKWMVESGKSLTTVGIYLRPLRAVYNDAIASGEVNPEFYPFGKRKYTIPASRNVKKALTISDIEKIVTYEPQHDGEAKARDLWFFSYLCNGINVKDMARLKYENIAGDEITFVRAKTERTNRQNIKPIVAVLTPEMKQIINRWGNKPAKSDSYIFPILKKGLSPEEELAQVRYATKAINKYIKRIAAEVGIEKNVSTYTARHSFSTVLKRSGASMELISESLGHSDMKTTENYLDSFESDLKKRFAEQLTAFRKDKEEAEVGKV